MEKQLIDFNKKIYAQRIGKLQSFIQLFENAIELYNELNLAKFEPKDFTQLICNTQYFIDEKLYQSKDFSSIAALGLSKAKLIEMIERPVGYSNLIDKIEGIHQYYKRQESEGVLNTSNLKDLFKLLDFDAQNKLSISQSVLSDWKESLSSYIFSDKGKQIFAFAKEMIELYKKYDIQISNRNDNSNFIDNLIWFEGSEPVINASYVSQKDRNAQGKS